VGLVNIRTFYREGICILIFTFQGIPTREHNLCRDWRSPLG
jgi:hypothetical protein